MTATREAPVTSWQPTDELVDDLRHCLARAPRTTAPDRFEAWAWRALLDEDGAALLTRDAAPAHITASAIILSTDLRQTCLVLHNKIRKWVQPGGHLEPGDTTMAAAAAREAEEETGLAGVVLPDPVVLSRHSAPCRPDVVDWHLDVEFALLCDPTAPVVSEESLDVRWFPVDALPADLASGTRHGVERAVQVVQERQAMAASSASQSASSASSSGRP